MSTTKDVLLNLNFSMKKQQKGSENWLWKSDFGIFWNLPITPICKVQSLILTAVDF